jgi:deazaflavin-dependent oxidoreductase (nitroreductase family)
MNTIARRAMAAGNNAAAWVYRRTRGRIGGSAKGVPVLLLTVAGRKTRIPRTVPVAYFEHGDGYLVVASAGGAKAEPQWIHNLGAARQAHITVFEDQYDVDARMLTVPSATNCGRRWCWPRRLSSPNTRRSPAERSRSPF